MIKLILRWTALIPLAGAEPRPCDLGKAYAKETALITINNIQDADTCMFECGRDEECHYFTYDAASNSCWLHAAGDEQAPPLLEDKATAIAGPLSCNLKLAYAALVKPMIETEEERGVRIMKTLRKLCILVREHGTGPEGVHRFIRDIAEKLQDASPTELSKMDFDDIAEVITASEELMDRRMDMSVTKAEDQGLLLTDSDQAWILARTTGEPEVDLEERESGNRSALRAKAANCGGRSGAGCSSISFGFGTPWTNAKVYYCHDVRLARSGMSALQCAMNRIRSAAPGIQFINVGYAGPGRCSSKPAVFLQSSRNLGCEADIGMRSGILSLKGNQILNLGPGCTTCGIAIHELLHTLGMAHEQQRPDRDKYITVIDSNIRRGMHAQFNVMRGSDTSQPYDTKSIMHYGRFYFSKQKRTRPTMVSKRDRNMQLGQKSMMTTADKKQLWALYNCQPPRYTSCSPSSGGLPWTMIGIGAVVVVAAGGGVAAMAGGNSKYADRTLVRG